jgi:hypothetical protein
MKKTIFMLIFITCSIPFSLIIGQNLKNPSWISGSWKNSLNSNLSTSFIWKFVHDSIFVESGLPSLGKKKCFSSEYPGYKQTQFSEDSLYRVTFSRDNDTAIYEFKLVNDRTMGKPALTIFLVDNGIKKVEHSKSADLDFF